LQKVKKIQKNVKNLSKNHFLGIYFFKRVCYNVYRMLKCALAFQQADKIGLKQSKIHILFCCTSI